MVRAMAGPGVYSATYSNIPVYEFQFGTDLKEHVMRRRHDDWINATHILKAAGFDKPARTRILEREVQKDVHEKVQGGYGKYQGTWVPLDAGRNLAIRNQVYDKIKTIFEFTPGDDSPPPAPKHTTNKPKVPKKPAVPKFHSMSHARGNTPDSYSNISAQLNDDDEVPDDTTVASASFMDEDDRYDLSQQSTGHRKRKRDLEMHNAASTDDQNHMVYSDELLDYFMLSQENEIATRPEPPPNFQPNWTIDQEGHTAMHWACAMGDVDVIKQLRRFGADLACQNSRGETPLMRAVLFTNCYDRQTMPRVIQEIVSTIDCVDFNGCTVIHHAASMTSQRAKLQCARYYLDVILNKLSETSEQTEIREFLDIQDSSGNTACHIAASNKARKCVRALIGRGASTDIPNSVGVTAEELIQELNSTRRERNPAASSSPFAPDSQRRISFHEPVLDRGMTHHNMSHHSEAAMTVESKVTPLILEKFQDLAKSFDEELIEKDNSEKEAKRLLSTTHIELAQVREETDALLAHEEDENGRMQELDQLDHAKSVVLSLMEQQQQLCLASALQRDENMVNGHSMHDNDHVDMKLELLRMLEEQQEKRIRLVGEYVDALALAGMGEKGDKYRMLLGSCLGFPLDQVDGQLEGLLTILEEDKDTDTRGSALDPALID